MAKKRYITKALLNKPDNAKEMQDDPPPKVENDDCQVGYKKPPRRTQFKKGRLGNPKGRPKKKDMSFSELVMEELEAPVTIMENGKKQKISRKKAFAKSLVTKSLQGDKPAQKQTLLIIEGFEKKQMQKAAQEKKRKQTFNGSPNDSREEITRKYLDFVRGIRGDEE
jgi:hypothetical protein